MENVEYLRGGASLKNENITFADGVYQMIEKATKIEVISVDSLYGFVFAITCNNKETMPFNITAQSRTKMGNIVLKITLLNTVESKLQYNGKPKRYQTVNGFNVEAYDMTKAYMLGKPYLYDKERLSISPDLLNHTILTGTYLDILINKMLMTIPRTENTDVEKILKWILKHSNNNGVGVMFMEYADPNSFQLFSTMLKEKVENPQTQEIIGNSTIDIDQYQSTLILSNMMVLLFEVNMVHCDLHTNNVFIKMKDTKNKRCFDKQLLNSDIPTCSVIIDFGRVAYLFKNTDRGRDIHLFPPHPYTVDNGPCEEELENNSEENMGDNTAEKKRREKEKKIIEKRKKEKQEKREKDLGSYRLQHKSFYGKLLENYNNENKITNGDIYVKYILQKLQLIYDTDKAYNKRMFGQERAQSATYFKLCGLLKNDGNFILDSAIDSVKAKQTFLLILNYLFTYYQNGISETIPTCNTYYDDPDKAVGESKQESLVHKINNFIKIDENKYNVIYNLKEYTIDLSREVGEKSLNDELDKLDYFGEHEDSPVNLDPAFIYSFQSAMLVGAMRKLGIAENNNTELIKNINSMIKEVDSDYSITNVVE